MADYHSLTKELQERIEEDRRNQVRNPYAFRDEDILRRNMEHDKPKLWRPAFVRDVEKILHNPFYNRYSDKTQVFSAYKNDDISRRALHVQLVSRVARNIGQVLNLNTDLIEAAALGHDIGHTPFGHAGERFLNELYHERTGRFFNHNVHSVRVLDKLVQRNISLQVLDGVLCHNGEMEMQEYRPVKLSGFEELDERVEACYTDATANKKQIPSTLEGCVMRISDIIAYLGKDRQDAVKVGILSDDRSFSESRIGTSNAEIINNMIVNIIENSYGKPYLSMDREYYEAFSKAKSENYKLIYGNPEIDAIYTENVKPMFTEVYEELLHQVKEGDKNSIFYRHHIRYIEGINAFLPYFSMEEYLEEEPNQLVVDFIASMTDDYFIDLYKELFPKGKYRIEYKGYF
ncbi:MAG: HD domain-containing protein [Thermoflexaceae bacterium]|nr:HD domain-containing protein [Thermoflexaceae bacterium]